MTESPSRLRCQVDTSQEYQLPISCPWLQWALCNDSNIWQDIQNRPPVRSMSVMIESMLLTFDMSIWVCAYQWASLFRAVNQCYLSTQMLLPLLVRCLAKRKLRRKILKTLCSTLIHLIWLWCFLRFMGTVHFCWWTPLICALHRQHLVVNLPSTSHCFLSFSAV